MLIDLFFSLLNGNGNMLLTLSEIVMVLAIVLFSLSAHEAAHAYAAKRLGDPTAYNLGRVTLNPKSHIHPMGFISMALIGIGWAKPVPINPANFRDPKKGMMLSSLAGPLSNFLIATVATLLVSSTNFLFALIYNNELLFAAVRNFLQALYMFFYYAAYLNFSLAVFNLIPCPPFDGSRIFFYFMPNSWYFKVMRYEQYLAIGILVIVLVLGRMGISPVSVIAGGLLDLVSKPFDLFYTLILRLL